jgi:hypothetical protein
MSQDDVKDDVGFCCHSMFHQGFLLKIIGVEREACIATRSVAA